MPDDSRALLQDALADRYRIERVLGQGGMATVYLAHDVRHDRPVALKVLHPELAAALGPERFQREIRVAARLQHPHVLTVHDSGEDVGRLWFTMPFVDGESLRDRLDRERQLPMEEALRIASEAADALDFAHRHGVVHRDVKPENILLSEGHALVADFGIARSLSASPEDERLTRTGVSIGTAAYMSPEQAAGERGLDARSDVYSLATVLYEMLAGETPFASATPQATLARRFTETARPLRELRETVPAHVERAVQRALARTPADRFATAADFARALQAPTAATTGVTGQAATPPRHALDFLTRRPAFTALLLGILLGGGALVAWFGGRSGDAMSAVGGDAIADGLPRVAVLPFENIGDMGDAYFADGMTDAVRGKLTELPGLAVIARASSELYRDSDKSPSQVAGELGVRFLLTGTVRWARDADGTSHVQVRPELVEVQGAGGAPHSRWQQPFDAPLNDVFAVQAEIAGRVATALDVALTTTDRRQLAERPTRDLEAYDLYLRAKAAIASGGIMANRDAIPLLEQAVARDSTFGVAWAHLVASRIAYRYAALVDRPSVASIEHALELALEFSPHAPETYNARAMFLDNIAGDRQRSLAATEEGLARYPTHPDLLRRAGATMHGLGREEEGLAMIRRAVELDPHSPLVLRMLGSTLAHMQRWPEALDVYRRVLELAPADMVTRHQILSWHLQEGDLGAARRVLAEHASGADRLDWLAFVAMYGDLFWVLGSAQQDSLLALPARYFEDDEGSRALVFAQIHHQRGNRTLARLWADSARLGFEEMITSDGDGENDQKTAFALLGLSLAYQERYAEAVRSAERGLAGVADFPGQLLYIRHKLARIHIMAGEHERALDELERVVGREEYIITPGYLRIDPGFAPLRGNPRFERLTRGG